MTLSLRRPYVRQINYTRALWEALHDALEKDERVFLVGEDIGVQGNIYGVTYGFIEEFGCRRIRNSPISEAAIIGAGIGAAILGMRPVVEIMYIDFTNCAMDQIVNQAAKLHYMTGGKVKVPLVIRTQGGAGTGEASQHSQSLEAFFVHVPGLKVVMPSTPYDAKGLLTAAIADENPVMFVENKLLYTTTGDVPEESYAIPLGVADVKREGKDITIVATSKTVLDALEAAEELAGKGIEAEVVDPRTLDPLDTDLLVSSVKKTGNLIVAHQACRTGGFGAEVIAQVAEAGIDARVKRVAGENTPIPYSKPLEDRVLPSSSKIVEAALAMMN
jgi:pyruvate/2-oxoglutarate/acetoin dehydrogenase E1 component